MDRNRTACGAWALTLVVAIAGAAAGGSAQSAASTQAGVVTTGGIPVPGATISAQKGDRHLTAVSGEDGQFAIGPLDEGVWTVRIDMRGFAPLAREITIPATDREPSTWELALLPFAEAARDAVVTRNAPEGPAPAGVGATASPTPPVPARTEAPLETPASGLGLLAADGFLINGSVNNGAASPFAQLRAFGNNRPGQRSLYNWSGGLVAGHSALDARPHSFAGRPAVKPDYGDLHLMGTFGGPVRIPGVSRTPTVFVGYQRVAEHSASTQTARVPTEAERNGNLSVPVQTDQITEQAKALLDLYPLPNVASANGQNYQATLLRATTQNSLQSRLTQPINNRNQLLGTFAHQRTTTDTTNLFGFESSAVSSGIDASTTWSYRFSPFLSLRTRYQFTRLANDTTPHFAHVRNVSGEAGISGNNQQPDNWGPPSLVFANGIAGLSDADHASTQHTTNGVTVEAFHSRGRHTLTIGGGVRASRVGVRSQQNPRGTFTFTGSATGDPFADFLLGLPHAASIASGTGDRRFRQNIYEVFVSDDWRVSPSLTVNAGVRWEYEAPITEGSGRLVNLDLTPGFDAAAPVLASDSTGLVTGARYPDSLLRPDKRGIQPRVGVAWRPVAGSSLVIRAGYGIYRNTAVYESIARLLAEQPPLATTLSVERTETLPLTLANGFVGDPGATLNTFAVDPDFRVGFAHNWQASVQRDIPASLTVTATYLGTRGSHLMQQFLPNTYPAGASNPCLTCPSGFVYLTSGGRSNRHGGQIQLRRRLRSGLAATAQYTLASARDNAAAFSGASVAGAAIAQDWLDLEAEYARSNFDQRHLLTVEFEYTTGMGVAGGALLDGLKGRLFKGWTVTSQLNAGSGLPLSPSYLQTVPGTGATGTIRPMLTGAPLEAAPGFYVNPAAYGPPAPGQWGNAGRNSITGPSQFSMNLGVSRSFLVGDRLTLDWRIDATNVLNRVTYAAVDTVVGSGQFGLPTRANPMRKLQTTFRVRF